MSSIKLTADSGGGTVELKAPATTGSNANKQFILPQNDGTANQALVTDASGNLSFTNKGQVLKFQQDLLTQTTAYGSSSNAYQEITNKDFVVLETNSKILIHIEINGYVNASNADRNFRLQYKVANGSYSSINYNTVNTNGNNGENMFGNVRGDDAYNGNMNVVTMFLLDANWAAGQTLNFKLETIGESSFIMNLAYSDGASAGNPSRFGRAVGKMSFFEFPA
jgi:hypothetical protein